MEERTTGPLAGAPPKIAIVEANTLAAIGLKSLLQRVMPIMAIDVFGTFGEFEASAPERYFHFFVSVHILLTHRAFFLEHVRKTIVLTVATDGGELIPGFHSINVNVSEKQLVKAILMMEQHAHAHGRNLPAIQRPAATSLLSNREIEVLVLIVRGFINKEIADKLNIGITTVISHRKNIMEKLEAKSVSTLTIYAVTHGYVDIASI